MRKNFQLLNIRRKAVLIPLFMIVAMWASFGLQNLGWFDNCRGAIMPLVPNGLFGVLFSPLLHGGWEHLIGNSVPIAVLLFLLYQFYPKIASTVFIFGWLLSGLLVWFLPPFDILTGNSRYVCIIGASGVVYVLAFFLFFSGLFRKEKSLLVLSLLVVLYYGSLVWGVLPEELFDPSSTSRISWESHLIGAIVGVALAYYFRRKGQVKNKKFIWEFPNYYSEKDDKLWQEYIENHPDDFQEMPQKRKDSIWNYLDQLRKRNH